MNLKVALIVAAGLFVIGMIVGIIAPPAVTDLLSQELASLQQLGSMLQPYQLTTFFIILVRNLLVFFMSFLLSPVLCLAPVVYLLVNGWLLAYISSLAAAQLSLGFTLLALLPHGIFEIPAFILSQAAGLSMGSLLILAIFRRDVRSQLQPAFKRNALALFLAMLLLVPAAAIETWVTPLLLG